MEHGLLSHLVGDLDEEDDEDYADDQAMSQVSWAARSAPAPGEQSRQEEESRAGAAAASTREW